MRDNTIDDRQAANEYYVQAIADTESHIKDVAAHLIDFSNELLHRAKTHDASKFSERELGPLALLKEREAEHGRAKFGTPEYTEITNTLLKPMIAHHYAHNRHHPEYHGKDKCQGMTLFDLMEMVADWRAAGKRDGDKEVVTKLELLGSKHEIPEPLLKVLANTFDSLGWEHDSFVNAVDVTEQEQDGMEFDGGWSLLPPTTDPANVYRTLMSFTTDYYVKNGAHLPHGVSPSVMVGMTDELLHDAIVNSQPGHRWLLVLNTLTPQVFKVVEGDCLGITGFMRRVGQRVADTAAIYQIEMTGSGMGRIEKV